MVWSLVSALMYTVYTQHSPDYTEYNQLYNIFGEKVILALSHKAPLCPAVPKFNLNAGWCLLKSAWGQRKTYLTFDLHKTEGK